MAFSDLYKQKISLTEQESHAMMLFSSIYNVFVFVREKNTKKNKN